MTKLDNYPRLYLSIQEKQQPQKLPQQQEQEQEHLEKQEKQGQPEQQEQEQQEQQEKCQLHKQTRTMLGSSSVISSFIHHNKPIYKQLQQ